MSTNRNDCNTYIGNYLWKLNKIINNLIKVIDFCKFIHQPSFWIWNTRPLYTCRCGVPSEIMAVPHRMSTEYSQTEYLIHITNNEQGNHTLMTAIALWIVIFITNTKSAALIFLMDLWFTCCFQYTDPKNIAIGLWYDIINKLVNITCICKLKTMIKLINNKYHDHKHPPKLGVS